MVANDPPIQLGKNCKSSTRLYSSLLIMYRGTLAPLELEQTLMATIMVSVIQHSSWLMNRTRLSQTIWTTHKQWNLSPELLTSINSPPPTIYTITNNQTVGCKIATPVHDKAIPYGGERWGLLPSGFTILQFGAPWLGAPHDQYLWSNQYFDEEQPASLLKQ